MSGTTSLQAKHRVPSLTAREHEVLECLSIGYSYIEIAEELNISTETVRAHCKHIYRKLGIGGRRYLQALQASQPIGGNGARVATVI